MLMIIDDDDDDMVMVMVMVMMMMIVVKWWWWWWWWWWRWKSLHDSIPTQSETWKLHRQPSSAAGARRPPAFCRAWPPNPKWSAKGGILFPRGCPVRFPRPFTRNRVMIDDIYVGYFNSGSTVVKWQSPLWEVMLLGEIGQGTLLAEWMVLLKQCAAVF